MIRDLLRYFFPKLRFKPVPRQIINEYEKPGMDEATQLLMMKNKARSPDAAQLLLRHYKAETAAEVLRQLPKRKFISLKTRLIRLIQKMAGHDERDPYRTDSVIKNKLD